MLSFFSVVYLPGLRELGVNVWLALLRLIAPVARYILAGVDDNMNPQETRLPFAGHGDK